jgi:hypothetical protein
VILLGHSITPGFALSHGERSDQTHLSTSVGAACEIHARAIGVGITRSRKLTSCPPALLIDDALMSSSLDDLRDLFALVA